MDYKKLEFKCGLEIHQQLETHKLFCKCPSLVNDENTVDTILKRKLRATAGEAGAVDVAAQYEMQKNKIFIYQACSTSSCLVEFDSEPPHDINEDALDTALIISLMLNANIVDEIQVMRKVVIDGSNVSGFQRTMLVARNGYIKTSKGKVMVPVICLEEEAAKRISEDKNSVTFSLDRLGVPLLEIATSADIKDPEHAKEVASILGMILRSTGRVKRGLGSIRQDVNISIKNGARTELKGFQDLKSIPKVIDNEIKRQLDLIKKDTTLKEEVRKVNPDFSTTFLRPMPGSSRMYPETDIPSIKITKNRLKLVKIPELITEKAISLEKKYKISSKLARELIKEEINFDYYVKNFIIEPEFIAKVLIEFPKEIKKRFNLEKPKKEVFDEILDKFYGKEIPKDAVFELLVDAAKGKKLDFTKYKSVDISNLEKDIRKIIEENKGASFNAIMGEVMKKFRGKVDGKKVAEIIKKHTIT